MISHTKRPSVAMLRQEHSMTATLMAKCITIFLPHKGVLHLDLIWQDFLSFLQLWKVLFLCQCLLCDGREVP